MQMANLVATASLCVSTVFIGAATDRFGIRRVAIPILLLLIASTYGLYRGAESMPFALLPLYALAGVGAGGAVLTPVMMIRAFPASVRFSGVSFSYNLAYALFGGLTPLLVSWLVHFDRIVPAHYVAAATIVIGSAIRIRRLILTSLVSKAITRSLKRCRRKTSIRNAEKRYQIPSSKMGICLDEDAFRRLSSPPLTSFEATCHAQREAGSPEGIVEPSTFPDRKRLPF